MQTAVSAYTKPTLRPGPRPTVYREVEARQFEFRRFIFALSFIALLAFVHVYQQALVAQNNIDISRLKEAVREENRVGRGLKVQKMLLESPKRLERLATSRLKMVKPAGVNYIVMPESIADKSAADSRRQDGRARPGQKLAKASLLAR